MNFKTLSILLVSLFLIGCAHNADDGHHEEEATQEQPIVISAGEQTIESELTKITQLAFEKTLKESDFETLESLVHDDESASLDVAGMKALARHGEFEHIQHTIGMLDRSLKAEGRLLCPAHDLGHYYVYEELGEHEVSSHLLERVKDDLHEWETLAIAYDKENPGSLKYQESLESVKIHLANIDKGITTAKPDDVSFLTGAGAICFSSSGKVEEHSHEEGGGHEEEHTEEEAHEGEDHHEEEDIH